MKWKHRLIASMTDVVTAPTGQPSTQIGRDGSRMRFFEGAVHHLGGWNSNWSPYFTCSEHYTYDPSTGAKTKLADADWFQCHTFCLDVMNSKLWKWVGDSASFALNGTTYDKSVWSYTGASGWVEELTDWGDPGDRVGCYGCAHTAGGQNYLYLAGGRPRSGVMSDAANIWRWKPGMNGFELVANFTDPDMQELEHGQMLSAGGKLIMIGGGYYGTSPYPVNGYVFVSSDDGVTWSKTLVPITKSFWCDGDVVGDNIFIIKGADGAGGLFNQVIYAPITDLTNWKLIPYGTKERHAAAVCNVNGDLWFSCGVAGEEAYLWKLKNILA